MSKLHATTSYTSELTSDAYTSFITAMLSDDEVVKEISKGVS